MRGDLMPMKWDVGRGCRSKEMLKKWIFSADRRRRPSGAEPGAAGPASGGRSTPLEGVWVNDEAPSPRREWQTAQGAAELVSPGPALGEMPGGVPCG